MERYTEDLAEFCPPDTGPLGGVVNEAFARADSGRVGGSWACGASPRRLGDRFRRAGRRPEDAEPPVEVPGLGRGTSSDSEEQHGL